MKKDKNEELQSRREFFKSAAKAALPIIGAAVLASAPSIVNATETPMGCEYGCEFGCFDSCRGGCQGRCLDTCKGSCKETCQRGCRGNCYRNMEFL